MMHTQALRLRRVEALLEKAIRGADARGYTGMVGSKGGLLDDPRVRWLIRERDRLLGVPLLARRASRRTRRSRR